MPAESAHQNSHTYRVHFSEVTFSSVEMESTDPHTAAQLAMANWAKLARAEFRTSPAPFRVEVLRKARDGTPYWELIPAP